MSSLEQKINYLSYPCPRTHPVLSFPFSFSLSLFFTRPLALCVIKSQNGCISFTNICRLRLPKRVEELWEERTETRESAILNSRKARGVTVLLTNLRRRDQRGPRRLYKFNNTK